MSPWKPAHDNTVVSVLWIKNIVSVAITLSFESMMKIVCAHARWNIIQVTTAILLSAIIQQGYTFIVKLFFLSIYLVLFSVRICFVHKFMRTYLV